jgi:thiamine-phosphate pyrophosphorylase
MSKLRGLYLVTPDTHADPQHLAAAVAAAIQGGARLVQHRFKGPDRALQVAQAEALLRVCRAARVPLLINDDRDLALALGADGVHLGRDDGDPGEARERLGPAAIIGVSCYDDLQRAADAERQGASYVAFGSFFPSATKPDAVRASPDLLRAARERLRIPAVAIGGITPQNGRLLIAAGACMLAVVAGVFDEPDPGAAASAYASLFPDGDADEPIP